MDFSSDESDADQEMDQLTENAEFDNDAHIQDSVREKAQFYIHFQRKAEFFAPPEKDSLEEVPEAFTSMRLSRPILKGISAMGFVQPTGIQNKAIPFALVFLLLICSKEKIFVALQ